MTEKEKVAEDFLRWCAHQPWDLLFAVPFPEGKTLAFRWVRVMKARETKALGDFYVLDSVRASGGTGHGVGGGTGHGVGGGTGHDVGGGTEHDVGGC